MHGNYTIPMSEYYAKSKDLHTRVEQTKESVEEAFPQKVSRAMGEIDSRDLDYLENTNPYRKVKQLIEKIEEHEEKISRMSSESDANNPMHPLTEEDQYYANRFQQLREGELTAEIEQSLDNMEIDIKFSYVEKAIKQFSAHLGAEEASRIMAILKVNPAKALEKMYSNNKFIEVLQKDNKVQDLFLNIMVHLETAKKIPQTIVDAIFNNQKFLSSVSKLPIRMQDGIVNTLISFQAKSNIIINKTAGLMDWVKTLSSLKPVNYVGKGISTLLNSKFGKTITSPWFAIGTTGVISAGKSYFDQENSAYKDVGKAVVGGAVDSIASIGPISGALIGAKAGPWGAVAGLAVGATIQLANFIVPDWKEKAKNGAYKLVDKTREIGKAIHTSYESVKGSIVNKVNSSVDKVSSKISENANQIKEKVKSFSDFLKKSNETMSVFNKPIINFGN